MSEDKLKLTPKQKDEVQLAFEEFGEHKYNDWKEKKVATQQEQPVDNRTEEQKKFETYLDAQEFYKAPITQVFRDLDDTNECMDKGAGVYRVGYPETQHKPDGFNLKVNDVGVVEIMFENMTRRDRPQIIQRYTSLETLRTFMRCYAPYTLSQKQWQPWKEVGVGGGSAKSPYKSRVVKATGTPAKSFEQYEQMANGRNSIYLYNDSTVGYQDMKPNDFVTIVIEKGKISNNTKMTMNIYGRVLNYKGGMFNELEYDGIGYSTGINTYTQSEIDDKIAHAGGGQGGGGSMNYIVLPTGDRTNIEQNIKGDFAVNLIDYRKLSKESGMFSITGSHIKVMDKEKKVVQVKTLPHVIKTKYKQQIETNTKDSYGGTLGMSGIKEDKKLIVNTHWYDIPKTDDEKQRVGEVKLAVFLDDYSTSSLQVRQQDVKLQSDTTDGSTSITPNTIGRYSFDLGTRDGHDAENYAVNFHAFYTKNPDSNPLIPHNLDRSFVFKTYNGHELKATFDEADEYHETKIGNVLVKKLGRVKIKDLDWYSATEINPDSQHFVYARIPDDCARPSSFSDQQGMKDLGAKLLTNNLSEVRAEDTIGHGTQSHLEVLKYDTNPPMLEKIIQTVPKHGVKDEWCFVLISNQSNAKHWRELLSETEILYPLKEPQVIYLKEGGYAVHLANGQTLYSHDFFGVTDVKAQDSYFFRYDNNGKGIRIHKSQIIGISPVNEI